MSIVNEIDHMENKQYIDGATNVLKKDFEADGCKDFTKMDMNNIDTTIEEILPYVLSKKQSTKTNSNSKIENKSEEQIISKFNKFVESKDLDVNPFNSKKELTKNLVTNIIDSITQDLNKEYILKFREIIKKIYILERIIEYDNSKDFDDKSKDKIRANIQEEIKNIFTSHDKNFDNEKFIEVSEKLFSKIISEFTTKINNKCEEYINKIVDFKIDNIYNSYTDVLDKKNEDGLMLLIKSSSKKCFELTKNENEEYSKYIEDYCDIAQVIAYDIKPYMDSISKEFKISYKKGSFLTSLSKKLQDMVLDFTQKKSIINRIASYNNYRNVLAPFNENSKTIYDKNKDLLKKIDKIVSHNKNSSKNTLKSIIEDTINKIESLFYPSGEEKLTDSEKAKADLILFEETKKIFEKDEINKDIDAAMKIYKKKIGDFVKDNKKAKDILKFLDILEISSGYIEKSINPDIYKPENLKIRNYILKEKEKFKN